MHRKRTVPLHCSFIFRALPHKYVSFRRAFWRTRHCTSRTTRMLSSQLTLYPLPCNMVFTVTRPSMATDFRGMRHSNYITQRRKRSLALHIHPRLVTQHSLVYPAIFKMFLSTTQNCKLHCPCDPNSASVISANLQQQQTCSTRLALEKLRINFGQNHFDSNSICSSTHIYCLEYKNQKTWFLLEFTNHQKENSFRTFSSYNKTNEMH
jgi:hypothetical protein